MIYQRLIRPLLFRLDPERAHHLAYCLLKWASRIGPLKALLGALYGVRRPELAQTIWGLEFPNPVGLAAGFDKHSLALPALSRMGFGFVEVGAISSVARPGNPRPRIFRLKADRGLINRMGLPNPGAEETARRLAAFRDRRVPVLANIVKTADLDGDAATMVADYVETLSRILPQVDGFTINISCPATPNLKTLGKKEAMEELLRRLAAERDRLVAAGDGRPRPLILKVSPDVGEAEKEAIVAACSQGLADGLVLTNTTTQRPASLKSDASVLAERGGLSGAPLFPISLAMVRDFAARTGGRTPIIAVGGIASAREAREMLDAGASLVEVYTGYVYEGPSLPRRIVEELAASGWRPRG
ncbi:MAG: quinone-dependent dihydroorotate dehydrogenase [Planctomycetes bacterium]|nr:quinone-dependent dihydroorotate dehydrogenase [Planctomycetota bacterium]